LLDEQGGSTCFKIEPDVSMREVLQSYYKKRGVPMDYSIILRYKGKHLQLADTPEKLGMSSTAELELETDYMSLLDELNKENGAMKKQFIRLTDKDKQERCLHTPNHSTFVHLCVCVCVCVCVYLCVCASTHRHFNAMPSFEVCCGFLVIMHSSKCKCPALNAVVGPLS
jgi:hypothetical protein